MYAVVRIPCEQHPTFLWMSSSIFGFTSYNVSLKSPCSLVLYRNAETMIGGREDARSVFLED